MRRVAVVAITVGMALALAGIASAKVTIVEIYFDPPGADDGSNESLNHEWIQIRNEGSHNVNVSDWRIRDESGHTFLLRGTLTPGQDLRVHTGSGYDSFGDPIHIYWGSSRYIWNNGGDTAKLKRPDGTLVDKCSYTGAGSRKIC